MRDKIMEKGKQIKEELTELIGESTEIFLRKYYGYCYKNYVEYEATTLLVEDENLEGFSSEKILEKIIECKKEIRRIPIKYINSISCKNHFYQVSDIFKIQPNRWGRECDPIVWECFLFYFRLFDISLDLVSVEYIFNTAMDIVCFLKGSVDKGTAESLGEFWEEHLVMLITARYNLWYTEMKALALSDY